MVELYLVRHAIAVEQGDDWPDDTQRPLTERGKARFADVVRGLRRLDVTLDAILTSPLVRARQTADLLVAGLPGKPVVRTVEALGPGHTAGAVMTHASRNVRASRVALVGHEPGLGELAAHIIGAQRALAFKKGGVCRIDLGGFSARRPGALIWFLPPKILRQLGGT